MIFGTLNTTDTLQALRISSGTVVQYGEDEVWSAVNALYTAYNALMREQLTAFCSVTSQRLRRYGNSSAKTMEELDEYGRAQSQKGRGASEVGFPLRKYGAALGWTKDYFMMTTTRDFAGEVTQILSADLLRIIREIKRAIYLPTNYTFYDRLIDGAALPVRRLANADSNQLPIGPNGQEFTASSHTHYLARVSTFAASDVSALIAHVTEHTTSGTVTVIINQAQEAAIRGFTSNFVPYVYAGLTQSVDTLRAEGKTINPFNTYNRAIGLFDGAEVWVKPWAIANYLVAMVVSEGQERPLAIRVRGVQGDGESVGSQLPSILNGGSNTVAGMGDLRLVAQYDEYPMRCNEYGREFGIGVQNRVSTAVLYIGGTSYVAPTITD